MRNFTVGTIPQWPKTNYSVSEVKREDGW